MSTENTGGVAVACKRLRESGRLSLLAVTVVSLLTSAPVMAQQSGTTGAGTSAQNRGTNDPNQTRRSKDAGQRELPDTKIAPSRGQAVDDRARESYEAQGIRAGSFIVFPTLTSKLIFNDNLFATPNDPKDDFTIDLGPEVGFYSDWKNHAFNGYASANIGRYFERTSEEYEDGSVGLNGRLDITRNIKTYINANGSHLHEERGSVDDVNGVEPTTYNLYNGDIIYDHKINRFRFELDVGAAVYRYDNTETSAGLILSDLRDRIEYKAGGRAEYMFFDNYGVFVSMDGTDIDYDSLNSDGILRSSNGYEARAGALIELTGVLSGDVYVGYIDRRYKENALRDTNAPVYGAGLLWNFSGLTTLRFNASQAIAETTSTDVSGILNTTAAVTVNHELKRNILLNGLLEYTDSDFRGTDRNDDNIKAEVGATYLLNQNFGVEFSLRYTDRTSTDAAQEYEQLLGSLSLIAKL